MKSIFLLLLFYVLPIYAQETISVDTYIVDRYPAQMLKIVGNYKRKRYFFIRRIGERDYIRKDSVIKTLKKDAITNEYENELYIRTPPFTDSIYNKLGQVKIRIKEKKKRLKITYINGVNSYIYIFYNISGLAKFYVFDYNYIKFHNHLKENLSFWGDDIPIIKFSNNNLKVYFFYDYRLSQIKLIDDSL